MTRIADAVHGTVRLSDAESAVVSGRAYQRLRGIKHLGLASLVFPGADYSRFAHGIGTLHVTSRILDSLAAAHPDEVTPDDKKLYRMAALLHDIGHYPFSHTFERALTNFYTGRDVIRPKSAPSTGPKSADAGDGPAGSLSDRWLHEELGRHVILEDPYLRGVLEENGIDADVLTRIIERRDPPKYTNLVSSDLDADRIDYLLRTAKHTGLPYGNVDLDYLLSQICLDNDQRICIRPKGLRAAEHVLLCRYFDYQQVSFHKTVAGLELVLNDAVATLLEHGALQVTPTDLQEMIDDGRWYSFDDAHIIAHMRSALNDASYNADEQLLFASILNRKPPKLLAERERLGGSDTLGTLQGLRHSANQHIQSWAQDFGSRFYVWSPPAARLTKIGANVPASVLEDQADEESYDKLQQSIRILADDNNSRPIQECGNSLLKLLSEQALYSIRIYALLPPAQAFEIEAIRTRVRDDLGPTWSTLFDS